MIGLTFRILSLLSLFLCLALLALWARSTRTDDGIRFTTGHRLILLRSYKDGLRAASISHWPLTQPYTRDSTPHGMMPSIDFGWYPADFHRWSGFGLAIEHTPVHGILRRNGVPLWSTKSLPDRWHPDWQGLDFYTSKDGHFYCSVTVPHWLAATAAAIFPLFALSLSLASRLHRRRRLRLQLCPFCSYDLRATPGRCPECGTASVESSP